MKITTFNPMVVTKKPEEAIALFEALGFERHHHKSDNTENEEQGLAFATVRMKDANGFYVDVCTANSDRIERDLTAIRMNVDDLDETVKFLEERGFHKARHDAAKETIDTGSSKINVMVSPTGYIFSVSQHIKDHD